MRAWTRRSVTPPTTSAIQQQQLCRREQASTVNTDHAGPDIMASFGWWLDHGGNAFGDYPGAIRIASDRQLTAFNVFLVLPVTPAAGLPGSGYRCPTLDDATVEPSRGNWPLGRVATSATTAQWCDSTHAADRAGDE